MHSLAHDLLGDRRGPAAYVLLTARQRLGSFVAASVLTALTTLRSWDTLGAAPLTVPMVMAAVGWALARRDPARPAP